MPLTLDFSQARGEEPPLCRRADKGGPGHGRGSGHGRCGSCVPTVAAQKPLQSPIFAVLLLEGQESVGPVGSLDFA